MPTACSASKTWLLARRIQKGSNRILDLKYFRDLSKQRTQFESERKLDMNMDAGTGFDTECINCNGVGGIVIASRGRASWLEVGCWDDRFGQSDF